MRLLYNVALKYCKNVFDAEDIVQETYLTAFHKFHQLREKSKCKPWLLRILRNNFLKNYQRQKGRKRLPEIDYIEFLKTTQTPDDAEFLLAGESTRQVVQKAIDRLPKKYREVLILYYMDEMMYKDIAATLDIPIGTVMSRLTRAREGVKIMLIKQMKLNDNNIVKINFKSKNGSGTK